MPPVIRPKFSIGQRLHVIHTADVSQPIPCPTCDEVGTVVITGETFTCPRCKGRKMADRRVRRWHICDSFTVAKLAVEVIGDGEERYDGPGPRLYIHYMAGLSGTMHYEEQCFPSREDANRRCDTLNGLEEYEVIRSRAATVEETGSIP